MRASIQPCSMRARIHLQAHAAKASAHEHAAGWLHSAAQARTDADAVNDVEWADIMGVKGNDVVYFETPEQARAAATRELERSHVLRQRAAQGLGVPVEEEEEDVASLAQADPVRGLLGMNVLPKITALLHASVNATVECVCCYRLLCWLVSTHRFPQLKSTIVLASWTSCRPSTSMEVVFTGGAKDWKPSRCRGERVRATCTFDVGRSVGQGFL